MFGTCTSNVPGISSLLVTVSGNNTRMNLEEVNKLIINRQNYLLKLLFEWFSQLFRRV